jgi:hypothetical protein
VCDVVGEALEGLFAVIELLFPVDLGNTSAGREAVVDSAVAARAFTPSF